ncbi:hypothetical protein N869_17045, partial [Cellulomonas bogoriensis 69B4 = DSM 16987]
MFQVEGGRSVPVEPLQPARNAFGPETSSVVADHLDALLGEQLLPLRAREAGADEPHLLAVDAAGQPVVVEVVAVLDREACLRALRYAGQAARLSTFDLAQAYQGGPDRFAAHLAAFRQTVPASALLSPSTVGAGARLLLVCSEIAPDVEDVIEFLLQPGWQVELLQVGIIEGADGRRIVDVSPVTRTPPPRRNLEPTALRLVRNPPSGSQQRVDAQPDARGQYLARTVGTGSWSALTPPHGTAQPKVPSVVAPSFAVPA